MSELEKLLQSTNVEDVKLGIIMCCQKYTRSTVRKKFSNKNPYSINAYFEKAFVVKSDKYWIYTYDFPEYIFDKNDDRLIDPDIELYEL